ncbi:MAG: C45 family peptidase [Methanocalculus sp.]|uniref:C45 family autoproteolytic acyltransferase/hydolase n=1 Tax=Methanocalculus sp. TaxID=2004547 RepID=UPI00271CED81|nr:C45 family peptidase [Methanocalculus sp.]MDO9538623.1 C45 family peptidase [Methanocalculus sp.]
MRTSLPLSCCLIILVLFVSVAPTAAYTPTSTSPVSPAYLPPPGVMPVIILTGSPYEMGYQYGLQVADSIAIVRDSSLASALSRNSYADIVNASLVSQEYIRTELPDFDFIRFFEGISDAMNDLGIPFSPLDPIIMLYYGNREGPAVQEHCTAFAVYEENTSLIAGVNYDYYPVPSNSYGVILALYPDDGYSCIIPSGAGRIGSNAVVNEQGLISIVTSGPSQGPGDIGPGIIGFLELAYVGMTAATVPEAENILLSITRGFSLNRLLADSSGAMEVIEASRVRYAIREPTKTKRFDSIIATNHYFEPAMRPSQPVWDPLEYNPSSYYRYSTVEKIISDYPGSVDYTLFQNILSSCDWWDGQRWHRDDPWSTNTVNRFHPDVSTLYSFIAVPGDDIVSICTGNPDTPIWGTMAPGQTGTYVNITVGKSPETLVYNLRSDAENEMWVAVKTMKKSGDREMIARWSSIQEIYWEGVWWHDHAILTADSYERSHSLSKAATAFSLVTAHAKMVRGG